MKAKKLLNHGEVKYCIADTSVHNAAKIMKSATSDSLHPFTKAAIKTLKSKTNGKAASELKVHESVTIPLNDPFHDV